MLDFLLVLGQVPGTNFQITFNEIAYVIFTLSAIYEYRLHEKAILRWYKWARYRLGVNYRKRKRLLKIYLKAKRYRLAVFERRIKRQARSYFRHRGHSVFMVFYRRYSLIKRFYYQKLVQLERTQRRAKRSRVFQNFITFKNFISQSV